VLLKSRRLRRAQLCPRCSTHKAMPSSGEHGRGILYQRPSIHRTSTPCTLTSSLYPQEGREDRGANRDRWLFTLKDRSTLVENTISSRTRSHLGSSGLPSIAEIERTWGTTVDGRKG